MSAYIIIDSDTQVTETPDLWTSRALAGMRVPRTISGSWLRIGSIFLHIRS